ncbi:histidinol phosphate phosphatase H [Metschnikowia bicuspidata]|uniref:Histidinol-phosphatase n=1 Tax=Metschnikowia bicuspidata TaxID=27322 RepID=A0A4P9ZER4_9ASCO|nr:histidinol phosphate phosphatase H [Metschnikowia bicuspidata]
MHSHHSHSGDYISHATGSLEDMVAAAKRRGFSHFCLTEHMPRLSDKYLYPEEIDKNYTKRDLAADFDKYFAHARKIQERENSEGTIKLLVGFEVEGIDRAHVEAAGQFLGQSDMCVGSVHHVNEIPIDFNAELWLQARHSVGGTSHDLYREYFQLQYRVLSALKPAVVGHFDLIRLFDPRDAENGNADFSLQSDWPEVWALVERNIKCAVEYGGLFEINSSAVRKSWDTPYPQRDIAEAIKSHGGRFCLSDDSHSCEQVGLNFHKLWDYVVNTLNLDKIYHLDLLDDSSVGVVAENVTDLSQLSFWEQYK